MMNQFVDAPFSLFLILINVIIGAYSIYQDQSLVEKMAFTPRRIKENGEYYRILSGGFIHDGGAHLLFNMITLYYFGPNLELTIGAIPFLIIYFGSGLTAHAIAYAVNRKNLLYSAVGASGSISGVLFAFSLYYPMAQLGIFFVIPMRAWIFVVVFVLFSVWAMRTKSEIGGSRIAHDAHLGGALGGALLTVIMDPSVVGSFLTKIGL